MGKWTKGLGVAALLIAAVWILGPRASLDPSAPFAAPPPGPLEAHLAASEAACADITPGAEKEIVWAGEVGEKTPLSVVYIHGFSASKEEIRPVPDRLADALGANLFYARLAGHGRTGAALGASTAQDWWRDAREALAIGRRLGERVLLVGVSTGATLATLLAAEDGEDVAGVIGVSPNFTVRGAPTALLTAPFAHAILPLVLGAERSWEPVNEAQAKWWTTRYPLAAAIEVGAVLRAVEEIDVGRIAAPVLFIVSDADEVVDPDAARAVAANWGATATLETVVPGPGDDPSAHVLGGDALSPNLTDEVVRIMLAWSETFR